MKRLGFLYDTTRCVGCKACQVACKEQNKLGTGDFFRRVETRPEDNSGRLMHFSGACNHCEHPACTAVCPTGAMYVAEDGTVQHDDERCVGCGRCVHHCPYGAPSLNKVTGYAQKCDACASLRSTGQAPVCVAACPTRALQFGPLESFQQEAHIAPSDALSFLPSVSLTSPSLLLRCKTGSLSAHADSTGRSAPDVFPKQEKPSFHQDTNRRFLILGGGVAAVSAAKAIRLRDKTAAICMVSEEDRLPYCRPMLSKGLLNSFSEDRYPVVSAAWLLENHVEILLGRTVTELSASAHTASLDDGRVLPFDKCIYALGSRCFVPPIPGHEKAGVFTLRHDTDLRAIRRQMLSARHAVVIGGGITGLEIAWELKKAGLHVTVLDMAPVLMGRLLDEKSSDYLRLCVERAGVSVVTGIQIQALQGDDTVSGVSLEDGRVFPAELVILSTGFRTNAELARQGGLEVGRAVSVTPAMETSCPDIYACGDCTDRSTATWLQSLRQGEVAGANAAGGALTFSGNPEPAMVHTAGTSLLSIGDMGKSPGEAYHLVYADTAESEGRFMVNPKTPQRQRTFFALCFSKEHLVGATLIGNLGSMLFIQDAVSQHWDEARFFETAAGKGIELHVQ